MRTERVRGAVAEDYGRCAAGPASVAAAEDVAHGVLADVGQVDDHAHAVHLVDEGTAVGAYAAPVRRGLCQSATW